MNELLNKRLIRSITLKPGKRRENFGIWRFRILGLGEFGNLEIKDLENLGFGEFRNLAFWGFGVWGFGGHRGTQGLPIGF